ncbi:MAG: oxidoreductase [Pseudomonadota bacterium]
MIVNEIRTGFYLDSVALMRIASSLTDGAPGREAALMMGTPANKRVLADAGLLVADGQSAKANDLIIALSAPDATMLDALLRDALTALSGPQGVQSADDDWRPASLSGALDRLPDTNLVVVSVPAEYAVAEARQAIDRHCNVMIFSDNVSLEDELALKQRADADGLLVMGPDCGTAYLAGVPLAFAHNVRRGPVGLIGASGTGLQSISVLVDQAGSGISHGFGVGGRDLDDRIGGISALRAIDLLDSDPSTERMLLISKPPGPRTAHRLAARLRAASKPSAMLVLGLPTDGASDGTTTLRTVKEAGAWCVGGAVGWSESEFADALATARERVSVDKPIVRGLFAGGTLCLEAQSVFAAGGIIAASNVPLAATPSTHSGIQLLDLGADEFTVGSPHPMLEPSVRNAPTRVALDEADVILVDFLLGHGSADDPTGAFIACLEACPKPPLVVASVIGTSSDPQGLERHVRRLNDEGVLVAPTSTDAARLVASLVEVTNR